MRHQALINKLNDTAEFYFTGGYVDTSCGICNAADAYDEMKPVMDTLGEPDGIFAPYTNSREAWEPRAWMCLFLAAWLTEDDLTYEEPAEFTLLGMDTIAGIAKVSNVVLGLTRTEIPDPKTLFETVVDRRYENEDGSLVMERNDDNLNKWELKNADTGAVIGEPCWYRSKVAKDNSLVLVDQTN